MKIRVVSSDAAPTALLSLADPSMDRVLAYARRGVVFVGEEGDVAIAAAVLDLRDAEAELMNLAVAEGRQRGGLGRQMLAHVLSYTRRAGVRRVVVGTGNSSFGALAFYQKSGFRVVGVVQGFFDAYEVPIVEEGIACRDMIRLAIDLPEA